MFYSKDLRGRHFLRRNYFIDPVQILSPLKIIHSHLFVKFGTIPILYKRKNSYIFFCFISFHQGTVRAIYRKYAKTLYQENI